MVVLIPSTLNVAKGATCNCMELYGEECESDDGGARKGWGVCEKCGLSMQEIGREDGD